MFCCRELSGGFSAPVYGASPRVIVSPWKMTEVSRKPYVEIDSLWCVWYACLSLESIKQYPQNSIS